MEVVVVIGTFGEDEWDDAGERTAAATFDTFGGEVLHVHGPTLASARNAGAAEAFSEWIVFLDADDRLEPGYLSAMSEAMSAGPGLLAPRVRYVTELDDVDVVEPTSFADRDIIDGMNPCAIGTAIRRSVFDDVGGFWEERAWEDWSLFRRAALIGEPVREVPAAVYRATMNPNGRNQVRQPRQLRRQILAQHSAWARRRGIRS